MYLFSCKDYIPQINKKLILFFSKLYFSHKNLSEKFSWNEYVKKLEIFKDVN